MTLQRSIMPILVASLGLAGACPADARAPMQRYLVLDRTDVAIAATGGIGAAAADGGGAGTLTLEGVSGSVTLALLYWNGIDVEMSELGLAGGDADYDQADIEFDGVPVTGTGVAGHGSNDCWPADPQPPSAALYRADVTARVAARGNGDYTFAGLADRPGHSANGVSLIVYFDDGNASNDLRVTHYEGMQSNTENLTFDPGIDYAGGAIEAVLHVSDGQSLLADGPLSWEAPGALASLPHVRLNYYTLYDGLPLWPGTSVPQQGHGRGSLGPGLWDVRRMPLTALFGPAGTYPTHVAHNLTHDCVSLQIAQIVQPADPGPTMLSPNPHDFGDVVVGGTTPPQRFTLTNLMPDAIEVLAPTIGNSQFQIVAETCGGATLQQGGTCTIDVTYTPVDTLPSHTYPLLVRFRDQTQQATPVTLYAILHGGGIPSGPYSRVEFDRLECAYPNTRVGSTSGAVHFEATNTGTLPVTIDEFGSSRDQDFVTSGATCVAGATLAPGATCAIDAAFHSRGTGLQQASLVLSWAADDTSDGVAGSDLEGIGVAAGDAIHADGFEAVVCSPW